MSRAPRPFVAWPRHPLTKKQFQISGKTARELAERVAIVERYSSDLRLGVMSAEEVDRRLRRLVHGPVSVERVAGLFAERTDVAANTRRRVASFVRSAGETLRGLELDALDGPTLERWESRLRARGMAGSSIHTAWRTLRQIVRYAAARGFIARSPWGTWRPRSGGAAAGGLGEAARTPEEIARLLDAARLLDVERERAGLFGDLEAKIATAAMLGLRQGELAGLRWGDLDAAAGTIRIARQWDGHALKRRRSPEGTSLRADPELFEILGAWRARFAFRLLKSAPSRFALLPIFPMRAGGSVRHYARGSCLATGDLRSVVERAGLPNPSRWSAHSLRVSFVTLEALARAGDLSSVAERSRHRSIGSLLRYLRSQNRAAPEPGFALPPRGPSPRELPPKDGAT
jgi:integrase